MTIKATHLKVDVKIEWKDSYGHHDEVHPFTLIMVGGEEVGTIAVADRVYAQCPLDHVPIQYLGHTMPWVAAIGTLYAYAKKYATSVLNAIDPYVTHVMNDEWITAEWVGDDEYPVLYGMEIDTFSYLALLDINRGDYNVTRVIEPMYGEELVDALVRTIEDGDKMCRIISIMPDASEESQYKIDALREEHHLDVYNRMQDDEGVM